MPRAVPLTEAKKYDQSAWGAQDRLVFTAVPAGASPALVGKPLVGAGALTVAGVYECLVPLTGMVTACEVHLTATIGAGTASTAAHSLFYVADAGLPSSWVNKLAFASTGALTSTVRQTALLSTIRGEQYARVAITLGGSPNVTFTQGEYNGI
jgi:hypothetical protein